MGRSIVTRLDAPDTVKKAGNVRQAVRGECRYDRRLKDIDIAADHIAVEQSIDICHVRTRHT